MSSTANANRWLWLGIPGAVLAVVSLWLALDLPRFVTQSYVDRRIDATYAELHRMQHETDTRVQQLAAALSTIVAWQRDMHESDHRAERLQQEVDQIGPYHNTVYPTFPSNPENH